MATAGLCGNRDESSRCIEIALKEVNVGNYEKALKFLKKARSLYATKEIDELIESISNFQTSQVNREKSHQSESSSARQRNARSDTANEPSNENVSPEYTSGQMDLVRKVNQCKSYYDVLSVPRDASDAVIKKAYKKLALQLHPDKNRAPGAAEAFKTVGSAVSILTEPRKRKEYDMLGSQASVNGLHSRSNFHQHYRHRSFDSAFDRDGDISAEELFNMFFGNFPNDRRRPGGAANAAHAHREAGPQLSQAFGLILVLILISMLTSFFTTDPVYSLSQSTKYPVRRETQHLSVPYYVRENFQSDYQGSLGRLENSVEEDFIYTMKHNCYRERSYRESMMARARSFGSRAQLAHAQGLKMPSCDSLYKIGITRYSLY